MHSIMDTKKPIASQYSLDKLETLVRRDIARIEEQLSRVGRMPVDPVRESTIETYKVMIKDRQVLLAQILEQSQEFAGQAAG